MMTLERRFLRYLEGKISQGVLGNPVRLSSEEMNEVIKLLRKLAREPKETLGATAAHVGMSLVWAIGSDRANALVRDAAVSGTISAQEAMSLRTGIAAVALLPKPPERKVTPEEEAQALTQSLGYSRMRIG